MRNPPLLLIIDDDKAFQDVLATKFRASGFEVQTAGDGEEGVAKAKSIVPDVILMDVKMPKQDGVQSLLALKDDERTKNIHVILMTAFGDPQEEIYKTDQRFAKELGAHEYVLKAEDLERIVAKVRASLGS
jgi:CheY-like chemotaxis protein